MTSKEYLELAIKEFEKEQEEDPNNEWLKRVIKGMKDCKQDLEVLEILKDNLFEEKGTGRFKGINVISCSLGNKHSEKDYYKVKEWLDE